MLGYGRVEKQKIPAKARIFLTRPKGFEPLTFGSVDRRSIQLSYGREFCFVSLHDLYRGSAGWRAQDKDNGIKLGATAAGRARGSRQRRDWA